MDYHQFSSLLSIVSTIINSQPLVALKSQEGEFHTIAPCEMLWGHGGKSGSKTKRALEFTLDLPDNLALSGLAKEQVNLVRAWRIKWVNQVFPDMVARPKWHSTHRNLRVGDFGHMQYCKLGYNDWRLAVVTDVKVDTDGIVPTVQVVFRTCHAANAGKAYVPKPPTMMDIGAQRFAVLLAVDEQEQAPGEAESLPSVPR